MGLVCSGCKIPVFPRTAGTYVPFSIACRAVPFCLACRAVPFCLACRAVPFYLACRTVPFCLAGLCPSAFSVQGGVRHRTRMPQVSLMKFYNGCFEHMSLCWLIILRSQLTEEPHHAVCNSTSDPALATDSLVLVDSGNNTARFAATIAGVVKQGTLSLSSPDNLLYGKKCAALWMSSVAITLRRSEPAAPFVSSNINAWLGKLGLANTVVLTGTLTFSLSHTPFPIPAPVVPTFFTSLQQAGSVVIVECADCNANPDTPPPSPRLQAVPGLAGLTKFWNFQQRSSSVSSLIVRGTAFVNLSASFSGLRCSPGLVQLTSMPLLTSLSGLAGLTTSLRPGPSVSVVENRLLAAAPSVAALSSLAGCPGSGSVSVLSSPISIATAACTSTVRPSPFCALSTPTHRVPRFSTPTN